MAVKLHRGGKRGPASPVQRREPVPNTAGQTPKFVPKEWGTKREFIGSGEKEYTFYSETRGTLTVRANNYWDALRQARARGYSRRQYRRKK